MRVEAVLDAPVRRIQYHKVWQADAQTDYVQIRYFACRKPLGRSCPYCEADEKHGLPFLSLLKHKFNQLWDYQG